MTWDFVLIDEKLIVDCYSSMRYQQENEATRKYPSHLYKMLRFPAFFVMFEKRKKRHKLIGIAEIIEFFITDARYQ